METPLRFSNPSLTGSRINQRALIFGQDETMPSLGKQELLKLCCASEVPQQWGHLQGHLCPLCAGTGSESQQVDGFHPWITNPQRLERRARHRRCRFHRFLWQKTEQLLLCKSKFKIYIITLNPPKLPRDIELMGSVKVFHTCVFLLCLILWEAFWRILQCKFQ